jgi:hypothetical protein
MTSTPTPTTPTPADRRRSESAVIRIGAVALPLGLITALAATAIHPHREHPMNDPAVFAEYAQDSDWIAVHFAQWAGSLLLFAGLLGVYYAIRPRTGPGSGLARLGLAAAGQATAAITALQAVDGVALKWAADAWVAAPEGPEKTAAFAAAEALRWTEYGFHSYANILLGLAVGLYGLAIARGTGYPRWLGYLAVGSAAGWITHGLMAAHIGLFDSIPRLVAQVLLVAFAAGIAPLMWRRSQPHSATDRHEPPVPTPA